MLQHNKYLEHKVRRNVRFVEKLYLWIFFFPYFWFYLFLVKGIFQVLSCLFVEGSLGTTGSSERIILSRWCPHRPQADSSKHQEKSLMINLEHAGITTGCHVLFDFWWKTSHCRLSFCVGLRGWDASKVGMIRRANAAALAQTASHPNSGSVD